MLPDKYPWLFEVGIIFLFPHFTDKGIGAYRDSWLPQSSEESFSKPHLCSDYRGAFFLLLYPTTMSLIYSECPSD